MSTQTREIDQKIINSRLRIARLFYNSFLESYANLPNEQKNNFRENVKNFNKSVIVNYDDSTTIYLLSRLCHWLNIPENNK